MIDSNTEYETEDSTKDIIKNLSFINFCAYVFLYFSVCLVKAEIYNPFYTIINWTDFDDDIRSLIYLFYLVFNFFAFIFLDLFNCAVTQYRKRFTKFIFRR